MHAKSGVFLAKNEFNALKNITKKLHQNTIFQSQLLSAEIWRYLTKTDVVCRKNPRKYDVGCQFSRRCHTNSDVVCRVFKAKNQGKYQHDITKNAWFLNTISCLRARIPLFRRKVVSANAFWAKVKRFRGGYVCIKCPRSVAGSMHTPRNGVALTWSILTANAQIQPKHYGYFANFIVWYYPWFS